MKKLTKKDIEKDLLAGFLDDIIDLKKYAASTNVDLYCLCDQALSGDIEALKTIIRDMGWY